MNNQHSIIYVMRHIDIGGYIEIPYKKVGITGAGNATLTTRLQQISNTKSPIKAQCLAAWEHHDAKAIETAIHLLLDDSRVEGEWFYDKDDTMVERMEPMMELLGAKSVAIEGADDLYTKNILEKESESKSVSNQSLLGEVSELLRVPLRTSIRKSGPTFFSDKTNLTYYISYRKSGSHNMGIGRARSVFDELSEFLGLEGYDLEQSPDGGARFMGVSSHIIAEIINKIESGFIGK